jgi:SAM-dependent methyltransferase
VPGSGRGRWLCDSLAFSAGRSHRESRAADIDVRFLRDSSQNVEVRRCDITEDTIEPSLYDLVHARNVLMHLRDPKAVLQRLYGAVRPGGWLMVEDVDNGTVEAADPAHPFAAAFDLCAQARNKFLLAGGVMNLRYGRTLPLHMKELKLTDVGNEAVTLVGRGRSSTSQLMIQSFRPMDEAMVANGVVEQSAVSDAQRALEDPSFLYRGGLIVATWGRKLGEGA